MIISIDPVDGDYRELLAISEIARAIKVECGCWSRCDCDPDTKLILKDGTEIVVTDSINTLEAKIESKLTGLESHVSD